MKGFQLLLLFATFFLVGKATESNTHEECDAETITKLSHWFGMHHILSQKEIVINDIQADMREVEADIDYFEGEMHVLEVGMNATIERKQAMERKIDSLETPELNELADSQICESVLPTDCCQIKRMFPSAKSGAYAIKDPCTTADRSFSIAKLTVNCNMESSGGGWIVIQRRNASMGWVNFTRNWADYERGFGDLDGEYWIGLKNIYELTKERPLLLQISVWNDSYTYITWNYNNFQITGPDQGYALLQTARYGSGGGSYGAVYYGNRWGPSSIRFSTYDRDHDSYGGSCAYTSQAGWWYYNCDHANPNGRHQPTFLEGVGPLRQRLIWKTSSNNYNIYTHSEMRIRTQSC